MWSNHAVIVCVVKKKHLQNAFLQMTPCVNGGSGALRRHISTHISASFQPSKIIITKRKDTFILTLSSAPPSIEILWMKAAATISPESLTCWIFFFFFLLCHLAYHLHLRSEPKRWLKLLIQELAPMFVLLCSNLQSCISCWQAPDF